MSHTLAFLCTLIKRIFDAAVTLIKRMFDAAVTLRKRMFDADWASSEWAQRATEADGLIKKTA